jgi:hypothetical protein
MTKFDYNLSTIIRLLSRLKPFLHGSQAPPAQKQFVETFACDNSRGELHVMEEGVRAERILEGVVVVGKVTIESPLAKSQPMQEYLRFTQFVEEPTCTKKVVNLASGEGITKSNGMEPKAFAVQKKRKALHWKAVNVTPKCA